MRVKDKPAKKNHTYSKENLEEGVLYEDRFLKSVAFLVRDEAQETDIAVEFHEGKARVIPEDSKARYTRLPSGAEVTLEQD